jgi:8-oxo-dGTP pyrophosphatase MutT (NUDIX family)
VLCEFFPHTSHSIRRKVAKNRYSIGPRLVNNATKGSRPPGIRILNSSLPQQLAARLQSSLPGWPAQARFQPELSFGRHRGPAHRGARQAAVLILLYPREGQWHLPMILRPAHMPDHAGQVSLPGGVIEAGETSREAALREYREELGAPDEGVELLGQLSELYLFATNFQITPWVGSVAAPPAWHPSPDEVDVLLEVPLSHFLDPANTDHIVRKQRGLRFSAPCFCWQTHRIWGATSMVLAELVASLADLPL